MSDHADLVQLSRKRGDEKLDVALGQLHKQAETLAKAAGIPDNICGHSPGALLGRIAYVPSMSRDLRRECLQMLSGQELNKITEHATTLDVREELDEIPAKPISTINTAKALEDTELPPPLVKTLKEHDVFTVGDVMAIPDEHLLKMRGIAQRSLEQIKRIVQ